MIIDKLTESECLNTMELSALFGEGSVNQDPFPMATEICAIPMVRIAVDTFSEFSLNNMQVSIDRICEIVYSNGGFRLHSTTMHRVAIIIPLHTTQTIQISENKNPNSVTR